MEIYVEKLIWFKVSKRGDCCVFFFEIKKFGSLGTKLVMIKSRGNA